MDAVPADLLPPGAGAQLRHPSPGALASFVLQQARSRQQQIGREATGAASIASRTSDAVKRIIGIHSTTIWRRGGRDSPWLR